ncbi:protein cup [Drosophila kikkawai]|uniref:Protein cup n=1 Tax=Drosophila kikkawai TaxID=30033 RepID=A0A6P4IRR6_DROKI|nr:protein cup [Drosophila kikkawai]
MQMAEAKQENGAGALKITTGSGLGPEQPPRHHLDLPKEEQVEEVLTPAEKGKFEYPPPPPPPTPVQAPPPTKAVAPPVVPLEHDDDEANSEKWEDPCAPPPPPPLPTNAFLSTGLGILKLPAFKLKDALEKAITKLEANRRFPKISSRESSPYFSETADHVEVMEMLPRYSNLETIGNGPSAMSMALILHPKTKKPAVIVQLERRLKIVYRLAKLNRVLTAISREAIPLPAASKPHEDEGLALQVLSARASTPYTQPSSMLSCTAVSCDLEHDSPKKLAHPGQQTHQLQQNRAPSAAVHKLPALRAPKVARPPTAPLASCNPIKHYARSHLLDIRNGMFNALMHRSKENFVMPRIATCDDIELEARLRRMNLWRTSDGTRFRPRPSTNGLAMNNNNNECMPAFYKNKAKPQMISDESIIQSQPPQPQTEFQDPAIVNQRRIGSGRFNHSKWGSNAGDYHHSVTSYHNGKPPMDELKNVKHQSGNSNMTVLQFFDNGDISSSQMGRPNTPVMGMSNNNRGENETLKSNESSEDLSRANENYVKRVMSGFLVVSKPKSRDMEEKHHRRYRNQSEEPEWFSCGPTSRLDTIELCGFDEDEERMLKEGSGRDAEREMTQKHKVDSNKYKWTPSEPMGRHKFMAKHDSNNNQNVENMNKVPAIGDHHQHHQKEEKRSLGGGIRSFQFDKFNQSQQTFENGTGNYVNQQQQHTNPNNSKFMSFFSREKNSSSSSLNEFFKQAMNNQGHANNNNNNLDQQPKSLGHMGHEMPSVEQLEAKWRRNSLTSGAESAHKHNNDNFQKLIGSLSATKPQQAVVQSQPVVGNDAISNFIIQQQQYQQQQQKQHVLIQQQQQQTAFLAGLQLKAILGRADTQLLLLRLTKGEISKHGLLVQLANPRLPSMDREAITAVLQFTNTQQQQQQHQQQLDMLSSTVIASQLQNLHNLAIVQQTLAARQQQQQQQPQPPQQLSQEDLQAHANVIMRNAVMKRKMEEQTSKLINGGGGAKQHQQISRGGQQQQQRHAARQDAVASNALLHALISGTANNQAAGHLTAPGQQQVHRRGAAADTNLRFAENQHFQTAADPSLSHFQSQYKQYQQQQPNIRHQNNNNGAGNNIFSKSQMQSQPTMAMLPNGGDEFH